MSDSCTVLITGGGTATALSVLKGLRLIADVRVNAIVADCASDIAGLYLADGFVEIPRADNPQFGEELLAKAKSIGADIVIPLFDLEFPALSAHREKFHLAGIRLVIPDVDAMRQCRDKLETCALFAALNVPYPMTYTRQQALGLNKDDYPLFVKPADGRGSIDIFRCPTPASLAMAFDAVPNPVVQQCIEGEDVREVTIDTISDQHGNFVGCCPRYRQVIKAGQSYKGLTFQSKTLEQYCRQICEALRIAGPACIQCFETPNGPLFIEVNPRFGAATILSIAAGLNGPRFLVEEFLGRDPSPLIVRAGVQMLRYWEEVFVDAQSGTQLPSTNLARSDEGESKVK